MWKEFNPAFLFLLRFVAVYLAGNIAYGLYISSYGDHPDRVTSMVSGHTCVALSLLGEPVSPGAVKDAPKVAVLLDDKVIFNVYEGCNGVNVAIVFMAFVIAFKGPAVSTLIFVLTGLILIHMANLARLSLLYFVIRHFESGFFFFHKYLFTAILYAFVFILWYVWVIRYSDYSKR
jgi:exosortase family protein XrtF